MIGLALHMFFKIFAMAKICGIGHDHQAPFQVVVVLLVLAVLIPIADIRQKQTTIWPMHLTPQIFLQILDPL